MKSGPASDIGSMVHVFMSVKLAKLLHPLARFIEPLAARMEAKQQQVCTTQNHSSILAPQPKNANQSTATSSSSDRAKSLIYCTRLQFGSVHYILIDFRTINNASAQPFPPHTPRRWEKQPTEADATDAGVCEWYFKHRS